METSVVKSAPARWLAEGCSVRGSSHERNGKPNQDHWGRRSLAEGGAVLAVADGHGSAKYFRSDVGSQLAVEVALDLITEMMEGVTHNDTPLDRLTTNVEDVLPRKIVAEWRRRVEEHWKAHESLADAEAEIVTDNVGVQEAIENDHTVAYGCTLLAGVVTARYLVLVQNGDGDIVCVSSSGKASLPMGNDPRLIANETTSLCQPHTERNFRVVVQELAEGAPALVTLSSDGCANSYEGDEFLGWVEQFAVQVNQYGLGPVREQLEPWLEQMTRGGSGDDVTLGVLALEGMQKPSLGQDGQMQFKRYSSSVGSAGEPAITLATSNMGAGNQQTPSLARTKPILADVQQRRVQGFLRLLFLPLGFAALAFVAHQVFSPKHGPSPPAKTVANQSPLKKGTPKLIPGRPAKLDFGIISPGDQVPTRVMSPNAQSKSWPAVSSDNHLLKCGWFPKDGSTSPHLRFDFDQRLPPGPMKASITFSFGNGSKVGLTIPVIAMVRKKG